MKTNRVLAIAIALVASLLVVVPATASTVRAQTPVAPTINKAAPGQVLAGDDINYTLTARNPGSTPLFNVTFRDVLPLGVEYAGGAMPAEIGDPQIIRTPVIEPVSGLEVFQQTLIWQNIADLQAGDDLSISFDVSVTIAGVTDDVSREDLYAVGSTVDNEAFVYGSTNERSLPTFDPDSGEPTFDDPTGPGFDADILGSSDSSTTTLTAIEVTKSEPSPEGELLRGVHDFVTTYTLTVDVTDEAGVDDVVLTDLLPAELEFLGCGDEDNSQVVIEEWAGTPPDPGSGPLGGSPVGGCVEPNTVETVVDPTYGGVAYTGVFTLVTWQLTDLVPGQRVVRPYAAGIPLRANVAFADPAPSIDGAQGSNLDNNTGASTRETAGGERAVTNRSIVSGEYLGLLRSDRRRHDRERRGRSHPNDRGRPHRQACGPQRLLDVGPRPLHDHRRHQRVRLGDRHRAHRLPAQRAVPARQHRQLQHVALQPGARGPGNPNNPSPVLFESVDLGVSDGAGSPRRSPAAASRSCSNR